MSKRNFVEGQINEIQKVMGEIQQYLNSNKVYTTNSLNDYNVRRVALNMTIISALIGADFVPGKKGETKAKFCNPLPTKSELATIASLVDNFISTVENPFLESLKVVLGGDSENDIEIPPIIPGMATAVPNIEKINGKKLKDAMIGQGGVSMAYLNAMDCIRISGLGEELRCKQNCTKMLIAGGIALLLTGAAVAGVLIYKKHKDDEIDDMINDIDQTGNEIEIDDDPAPIVEIA